MNSIATSNGYGNLTEDDSYVLGQWVHSERSDVEVPFITGAFWQIYMKKGQAN